MHTTCDHPGCNAKASPGWRVGEKIYCRAHAWQHLPNRLPRKLVAKIHGNLDRDSNGAVARSKRKSRKRRATKAKR